MFIEAPWREGQQQVADGLQFGVGVGVPGVWRGSRPCMALEALCCIAAAAELGYPIDQIPTMGIKTRGVKAQNYAKGDNMAGACAITEDDSTMLFLTENGMMKRVKLDEIPENNRPAKGNLICKRIKSNPSVLTYASTIFPGDELEFYDPEKQSLRASDIALKPVTTTFSQPLVLKKGWYLLKGIEEARIIDIPEGEEEEAHSDVETMTIFDMEENA